MKSVFKLFLKYYLKFITKYVLMVHRPTVIAIAGSTNKTFIKDEVNRCLRAAGLSVRSNPRSFNTEIGLPLAILGLPSGFNSYSAWLPIIAQAARSVFKTDFPEYLVLELGVADAGDMKFLLSIIEPDISIIGDITQRYLEGFADMDELVGEYELLVKRTDERGLVILNNDNLRVRELKSLARARVVTFGLEPGADWQAKDMKTDISGQTFTLAGESGSKAIRTAGPGRHHISASLVGLIIDHHVGQKQKIQENLLRPEASR
jgi:UDP-N-acetylmuramoyl-tripeptide--D-alanyl-D-alanine ligase